MSGRTISHYEILEKVGEGGMGLVYRARDTRLDRIVALKLLHPDKLRDKDRVRRFAQEARSASALNHPNIVTVHDISSESGSEFIVMEYVDGKTLDQLILRKGMPVRELLKISVQIADALTVAAAGGVIHRDIKPSNIMVTRSGLVKVLDFGLAKLAEKPAITGEAETATLGLSGECGPPRTGEGAIVGTLAYLSPEQAEGKPLDPRSDIFSFGSLLFEMATGQRAFRARSAISTLASILRDNPHPARELSPGVPPELDRVIARCLRKDLERRFQHMSDVRVALLEIKEESESGRFPLVGRRARAWYKWLPVAGVLLILIAAAGIQYGLHQRTNSIPSRDNPLRVVPFATSGGLYAHSAFSPDGNQLAYSWNGGQSKQKFHIYVQLIGTDTPLQLTSGEVNDVRPAWSPDGRSVAFLRTEPAENAGIYQVSPWEVCRAGSPVLSSSAEILSFPAD